MKTGASTTTPQFKATQFGTHAWRLALCAFIYSSDKNDPGVRGDVMAVLQNLTSGWSVMMSVPALVALTRVSWGFSGAHLRHLLRALLEINWT